MNLLSPDVFEELKKSNVKIKYLANQVNIQSFNGTSIPFKNCIKMSFKLQNSFTYGTLYVTTKNFIGKNKMLLNYDFLKNNQMVINLQKQTLKLKNTTIKLNEKNEKEEV